MIMDQHEGSMGIDGISLDTNDILKKAVYKAFGSENIECPEKSHSLSNSSLFLTGSAGKNLMLPGTIIPSAESSLQAAPSEPLDWSRDEDELLLRLLPEVITSVEGAVEKAMQSLHSRTEQEIRERYHKTLLPLIAEEDSGN